MVTNEEFDTREKLTALWEAMSFNWLFVGVGVLFSVVTAALEGFGMSFIVPIIAVARQSRDGDASGINQVFVEMFEVVGIPFTLEYIILAASTVILVRYGATLAGALLRAVLEVRFLRELRHASFDALLEADVAFFDRRSSDQILNAIITQTDYGSRVLRNTTKVLELGLIIIVYLGIALYLAPLLAVASIAVLAVLTFVVRYWLEPGYEVGDMVAKGNEGVQEVVQTGAQGIRDIKMFGMRNELLTSFSLVLSRFIDSKYIQRRNKATIQYTYRALSAIVVFGLIYASLAWMSLTVGELGVFLFAMFRLAPRASALNNMVYSLESNLPHLVRTYRFIDEVEGHQERKTGSKPAPTDVDNIAFDDVSFSYTPGERVLRNVSFEANRDEFVAFVGQSGAGKSTIVSLLAGMYEPDGGEIRANGTPIRKFDIESWRDEIAIVRQDPYIFDDTLWYNLTVGTENATEAEVDRACEIASVSEFFEELSDGYDTRVGEDGIQLSGGQRQRVALARALLKDASILILDEATSDLDTGIERQVQESIESMDRGFITIAIAHRLSTVMHADRIYTVKQGEISETGTHDELLTNDGIYASLYRSQIQT